MPRTPSTTVPPSAAGFTADQADRLDAVTFAAWCRARDAQAVIESARRALDMLYPVSASPLLGVNAIAALRYTLPPGTFTDPAHVRKFADALGGDRVGGSDLGPMNNHHVFAPAACSHLGATFEWATPDEVERRVTHITAAATPQQVDRRGRAVSL